MKIKLSGVESAVLAYEFLTKKAAEEGVELKSGFPIFKKEWFCDEIPKFVTTFSKRKQIPKEQRSQTCILFYEDDKRIWNRIWNIDNEIDELSGFMAISTLDITLTNDMESETRKIILSINHLYGAIHGAMGNKIVLNSRLSLNDFHFLREIIPSKIIVSVGLLGCKKNSSFSSTFELVTKLLMIRPSFVIIYGSKNRKIVKFLRTYGIDSELFYYER